MASWRGSTCVANIDYDEKTQTLDVTFVEGGQPYLYRRVQGACRVVDLGWQQGSVLQLEYQTTRPLTNPNG